MDKLDTAKTLIENCLGASLSEITRDSLRMALREIEEYQLSVKYLDLANVSKSVDVEREDSVCDGEIYLDCPRWKKYKRGCADCPRFDEQTDC